jgi:hypothetical protein
MDSPALHQQVMTISKRVTGCRQKCSGRNRRQWNASGKHGNAKTLSEEQQRGLQDPQVAAHLAGRVPITCSFPFEVEGIPKSDFYTVQVGSGDRGSLTFKFDQLEQQDWKVV